MDKARKLLKQYVDAATDLAESVKRNIVKTEGCIDDTTVNKLNDFMIATNELAEFEEAEVLLEQEIQDNENENDPQLN